ncbi:TonB-dependent receptor [Shewanella sp. 202IG2-18]|uniref:TonB-dependent receptor n=1 Tax=Parashewanella hymeniacidonis TaxID=2807618 RepID=UPI001960432D|nr:TonB-dependent receptor [Parashewanella hymeniacidonis]MBM7073308.1 TonB-dependent receptor [Parashewanella hymeniacidonis]
MFTKKTFSHKLTPLALSVATAFSGQVFAQDNDANIEVIKVTADFRNQELLTLPASATIIDAKQIEDEGNQHFEDVLNSIANFNWSGGSSRPRYFQIRGVGEQEDYQGAPNSSVGYVIDDIDLSGLGMVSSMYDLQQVEVLRGPQGTRYGANALAGLIYLKSNDPEAEREHGAEVSFGDDNLRTFSGYSTGAINKSETLLYRATIQQHDQDGFRDNTYLGRSDTNKRDEFTGRIKLRWLATDDLTADLTVLHADFDNGYDAWTLDNNGFKTNTDQPGVDNQKTTGTSLKLNYTGFEKFNLTSITSYASTDHQHAYDGDWANPDYWASRNCGTAEAPEACEYDYLWDKKGDRRTISQEFRFSSNENGRIFADSTDWLVGVYAMNLKEDNDLYSEYNTWPDEVMQSKYNATNYAVFAQLDSNLGNGYNLSTGLRLERRNSEYSDTNGDAFKPSESMWGGHIALSKKLSNQHSTYVRVARGYKAGGFNMSLPAELADKKEFDTEILYNYEIGLKSFWLNNDLSTNLSVFYMDRQDQQVSASQQDPEKPQRFILFTENAGSSKNYGAELDAKWQATDNLEFYASIGYLEATYGDYIYKDKYGSPVDLSGRELAHSPKFTNSLGTTYRADNGIFVNLHTSGKSKFFYSDSNDSQSKGYQILNARVGYEADGWGVYLWGRNLFDKKYGVRGFYFGNEPDLGWADKQYIRYGDPRSVGVTANIKF